MDTTFHEVILSNPFFPWNECENPATKKRKVDPFQNCIIYLIIVIMMLCWTKTDKRQDMKSFDKKKICMQPQ